jgi:hypothetical protein
LNEAGDPVEPAEAQFAIVEAWVDGHMGVQRREGLGFEKVGKVRVALCRRIHDFFSKDKPAGPGELARDQAGVDGDVEVGLSFNKRNVGEQEAKGGAIKIDRWTQMLPPELGRQHVPRQRLDEDPICRAGRPNKMKIELLCVDNVPAFQALVMQSARRGGEAAQPEPTMNSIKAVNIEVTFEKRVDVGTDEANLVVSSAICRWQERRAGF